jgi:DNA mismatch endonuclease (patch repair protein)
VTPPTGIAGTGKGPNVGPFFVAVPGDLSCIMISHRQAINEVGSRGPCDMDKLTPAARSAVMARIGQKDTAPEMLVRRTAHRLGFRYQLHRRDLPGSPDLVFPRSRRVIFVHGCFWHAHGCKIGKIPQSRQEFWVPKLARTQARDLRHIEALEAMGWTVLVIWECQAKDGTALAGMLTDFLARRPVSS